ncbi:MAG: CDP-archaeol synthase [Candidatus Freyarchaeota archaeon]|nr:CDP-archaeol synthase [Candidatus Jordarchaeia archaeon]
MDPLTLLLLTFWYILPAYTANGLAVIFGRGNRFNVPLDLGRNFIDGRRIFGDGKTLRGFIGGVAAGTMVGAAQAVAGGIIGAPLLLFSSRSLSLTLTATALGFYHATYLIIINAILLTPIYFALLGYPPTVKEAVLPSIIKGFLLPLGALTGDLVGSFIKRRLNISRGHLAPGLDQLDFVAGAILLSSVVYIPPPELLITAIIVTPAIHLLANAAGYALHLKNEPW